MLVWAGEVQMVVYWKEVVKCRKRVHRTCQLENLCLVDQARHPMCLLAHQSRHLVCLLVDQFRHPAFFRDDVFALQPNFMNLFSPRNLDLFTRICQYRFSHARRISKIVFGIITNHYTTDKLENLQWQI